jgi:diguanylate cyclase (GGDEF)-like protein
MDALSLRTFPWSAQLRQTTRRLDWLLYVVSAYGAPVAIVLFSIFTFVFWRSVDVGQEPRALEFQVLGPGVEARTPQEALPLLQRARAVKFKDTELSEAPFWVAMTVPPKGREPVSLELPSRHASKLICWQQDGFVPLGQATSQGVSGSVHAVKAGFAVDLGVPDAPVNLVCCVESVGPARMSFNAWDNVSLQKSAQDFQRRSGQLKGGILVLAAFVLITAIINRSGLYMVFSAWLILNLRMGALSAGWDTQWLGNEIPDDILLRLRSLTMAAYYLLSITLFARLFREDLGNLRAQWPIQAAQWLSLPLLLASAVLPYAKFLPLLWTATAICIVAMLCLLALVLARTRSTVAMWFAASVSVTIIASLSEVVSAALGLKGLIGSLNSVTAALSSSLLAALAIAAQLRQEHDKRLETQAELSHTYEVMPLGMFALDLRGRFISANPALKRMLSPTVLDNGGHPWQRYFSGGAWAQLHNLALANKDVELELRGRTDIANRREPARYLVRATLTRGRVEGTLQDITEKAKATEELVFLVHNDPLTKVLNRRGVEKAIDFALSELSEGKPLALAYLDLDRFRLINDLYGHSAGDEVLQQVCGRVKHMISGSIQFGRVGGDEFVLVMPDTKIPVATLICRGIIESLSLTPYRVGDRAFHVRGSIGLIDVQPEMQVKDAISTADRACHDAKRGRSEGLMVYERDAKAFGQHEAEMHLVERLSTGSATDGLHLLMQPIMSLSVPHGSLNFEVLLRMNDEEGRPVPTERLIAAAETSGRMGVIDRWVLSNVLHWLNDNQAQLRHTRFVCMNLSGASLNDERFLQDVYAMLEQNIHVVSHLCLEITESVALHDLINTRRFVDKVRSMAQRWRWTILEPVTRPSAT